MMHMQTTKTDIKSLTLNELEEFIKTLGFERYRGEQIFTELCKRVIGSSSEIRNLPKALKEALDARSYFNNIECVKHLVSSDLTEKFLFSLNDRQLIESVLIVSGNRKTLCISTQVGCKFGCAFCASGDKGFIRDLKLAEILGQVIYVRTRALGTLTNYVFMGMGEPLDNIENLLKTIEIMTSKKGMGIGAHRITVSTCGVVPGIRILADCGININLSLSLHATTDAQRSELMPANRIYPMNEVLKACGYFAKMTKNDVTLEYVLLGGKNDSAEDAQRLAGIAGKLRAKVNLIPYSSVHEKVFVPSANEDVQTFRSILEKNDINVLLRESKGKDIEAACGQLAYRLSKK